MRFKSVLMLVSVVMVLVATGIGNALAASWLGSDWSHLTGSTSASYTGYVTNKPNANVGETITWQNNLANEYGGSYWPEVIWIQGGDDIHHDYCTQSLGYHGSWAPDEALTAWSPSGDHNVGVVHQYDTSYKGSGPNTGTYTQYYHTN